MRFDFTSLYQLKQTNNNIQAVRTCCTNDLRYVNRNYMQTVLY